MNQPLDYERADQSELEIEEFFERQLRAARRQKWAALIACAVVGILLVLL